MKKLSIVAAILAVVAAMFAGVAVYIAINGNAARTPVTVKPQETSSQETVETQSTPGESTTDTSATQAAQAESGQSNATEPGQNNTAAPGQNNAADSAATAHPDEQTEVTQDDTTEITGEETVGAPGEAEPETTATGLDLDTAQSIHDAYIAAAQNATGDMERGYYIYDIDKDGIPELLLTHEDGNTHGLSVWTYENGAVVYCDVMWGFAHGYPFPASYPDGNGIVLEETARGYECIWVISKNGTELSDTVHSESSSVYSKLLPETDTNERPYYTNIEEYFAEHINHQYYPSVENPFFEGSEALGLSDTANDTAILEALGIVTEGG